MSVQTDTVLTAHQTPTRHTVGSQSGSGSRAQQQAQGSVSPEAVLGSQQQAGGDGAQQLNASLQEAIVAACKAAVQSSLAELLGSGVLAGVRVPAGAGSDAAPPARRVTVSAEQQTSPVAVQEAATEAAGTLAAALTEPAATSSAAAMAAAEESAAALAAAAASTAAVCQSLEGLPPMLTDMRASGLLHRPSLPPLITEEEDTHTHALTADTRDSHTGLREDESQEGAEVGAAAPATDAAAAQRALTSPEDSGDGAAGMAVYAPLRLASIRSRALASYSDAEASGQSSPSTPGRRTPKGPSLNGSPRPNIFAQSRAKASSAPVPQAPPVAVDVRSASCPETRPQPLHSVAETASSESAAVSAVAVSVGSESSVRGVGSHTHAGEEGGLTTAISLAVPDSEQGVATAAAAGQSRAATQSGQMGRPVGTSVVGSEGDRQSQEEEEEHIDLDLARVSHK